MTDDRFDRPLSENAEKVNSTAFLLMPISGNPAAPVSPLEWLYQKMYEQAQRVNQQPAARDLFAVMN